MKTVFLVDDSTSIRNIIKGALVRDYRVAEAVDGQDALDQLAQGLKPDVFLLDVNMPRLDGLGLLARIKGSVEHRATPVIMLTTETKAERRDEAKALGATGWILKPCDPDVLLKTLKSFV